MLSISISTTNNSTQWQEELQRKLYQFREAPFSINQMIACLVHGDGVGSCAVHIRSVLREWGIRSYIFTHHADNRSISLRVPFEEQAKISNERSLLFLHPSDGTSPIVESFKKAKDRKYLYYHNITPASFFSSYDEKTTNICETAYQSVKDLLPHVEASICDSQFNASDLEGLGFSNNTVIPLPFFRESFGVEKADSKVLQKYSDGKFNLLFVGRIAPNKCQHDLVKVFNFYKKNINPNSRLIIAGHSGGLEKYTQYINELISSYGLVPEQDFVITGHISFPELIAYYKVASAFLCLSEHEGFCLPLLESMNYKVPVVAYSCTAVKETIANSSILLDNKDAISVSLALEKIRREEDFKNQIIQKQLQRIDFFALDSIKEKFAKFLCEQI